MIDAAAVLAEIERTDRSVSAPRPAERAELGVVFAACEKTYVDVLTDPMNEAVGYTPDPMWTVERTAWKMGWSLHDVCRELDVRGIETRRLGSGWVGEAETAENEFRKVSRGDR